MITLRQFQQFVAVAETMSFRAAAQRLDMAQPPLTTAIRLIEQELGVRLFERTNRVEQLTSAGRAFYAEAQRTLAQAERAISVTRRAASGTVGSLRIGFVATAARYVLPSLMADFRETHPDVSLELREETTARQIVALKEDRLDLGIVVPPLPASAEYRVATRTIVHSNFVAAIPNRHRLARERIRSSLSLRALANELWILFPQEEGPGLHSIIARACAKAGFAPRVAQQAVQMETTLGFVSAGLGVALVPRFYKEEGRRGVAFRTLVGSGSPVIYELALAWRTDDQSPALTAFLASVENTRTPIARPT
jgi:DNA-binding transcriptional LysR family regulator